MSGIVSTESFTFEVTFSETTSFVLPFIDKNSYNCTVDWGDGTSDTFTAFDDPNVTHSYDAGVYEISITGFVGGWSFNNSASADYVTDIISYGTDTAFTSGAFEGCSALTTITADDAPGIVEAGDFFRGTNINDVKILDYDFSCALGYTSAVFASNPSLTIDISPLRFNCAFTLTNMLQGCTSFDHSVQEWTYEENLPYTINQSPLAYLNNAGLGAGGTFSGIFNNFFDAASAFDSDVSRWYIAGGLPAVTRMFRNAINFNQPVATAVVNAGQPDEYTAWDVSEVSSFSSMFNNADAFNQSLDSWQTRATGVNVSEMFYSANSFNNGFAAGVSNGTAGVGFCGWKVLNVDYAFAFIGGAFNSAVGGWDVSSCTRFNATFANCSSFDQDLTNWNAASLSGSAGLLQTFVGASSFNNGGVGGVGAGLDTWDVSNCTSMLQTFNGTAFNQYIGSWDVSSVTNFADTFRNTSAFNQDISGWVINTSADVNMGGMFRESDAFNQDISGWNTSSVTSMGAMFYDASAFNQNISGWNTSSVTNMGTMFRGATVFDQNLGSWNLSAVTNVSFMFYQAGISDANLEATLYGWSLNPNTNTNVDALDIALNKTYASGSNMDLALNDPTNGLVAAKGWTVTGITIV